MSDAPVFASTREALGMLRVAMGYLAAADPTTLAADAQAECLQELEQIDAIEAAARAKILGAFTAGQSYCADGDYSPRSWLIHRTRITRGARRACGLGPAGRRPSPGRGRAGRWSDPVGVLRPEAV